MTDEKEKIYEEHKSQIFRSKSFDDYSIDEIEEAFYRVLMYLPNDAKLYKYRKFEEKSFNKKARSNRRNLRRNYKRTKSARIKLCYIPAN